MLAYSGLKRLTALMLIISLLSFSSVYAQSSRQSSTPPRTIDFAGVTYDLAIEKSEFNFGKWHYRPELLRPQQSHLPELILTWRSDEWISDTFDKDTCPPVSEIVHKYWEENKEPPFLHVVAYNACNEIYELRNETPGVIKTHEDERNGEILIASIITGKYEKPRDFVRLTLSRYIPVPVDHYDGIDSVLHYAYVITAYGPPPPQEQAAVLLEKLNQEGEQWLNALLEAPVPQFILDRAKYYEDCSTFYGDKSEDHCPW